MNCLYLCYGRQINFGNNLYRLHTISNKSERQSMVPFYRTFPFQEYYKNEEAYERDLKRLKEAYPKEIMAIQNAVEKRCDELEYEGSPIYDEEPDRQMIQIESEKIAGMFMSEQSAGCTLCSIINILLNNEICLRRCRYRRYRRFW